MKVKKKGGKVFPSSSSSSSVNGTRGGERENLSVLKFLPAAILALVSTLCFEDREVLAYMITRSINPSPSILSNKPTKRSNHNNKSKSNPSGGGGVKGHKPPVFDCDCFHCYTNYWHRWNFSPNRDLIEEAIEAFEEHLSNDEKSRKSGKRRDKGNRRNGEKPLMGLVHKTHDKPTSPPPIENVLYPITSSETVVTGSAAIVDSPGSTHKGFARKVLPDLLGLLNSRLWSLWNPNA